MDLRTRSFTLHAGGVLAIVSVLIAVDLVVAVLTSSPGTAGWTLPGFSSAGATMSGLSVGVWVLTYLLAPVLIFALGYRYGMTRSALESGQ